MRRRARGWRALALVVAWVAGCRTPPPPPAPVAPATASSTCAAGRVVACECRAGKGYRTCEDGVLRACICHRGQKAGLSDRDAKPPTRAELAQFTRDLGGAGALRAELRTSMGVIDCALFPDEAPLAVANFVGLARGMKAWRDPATGGLERRPYYDGLTFHRVLSEFIIQTGDPLGDGTGGPGYLFPDETGNGRSHEGPGTLAMANRNDPDTNGSQFYITLGEERRLDATNTVFGQCENLDVIRAISRVRAGARGRPLTPVILERVRIYRGR